VSTAKLNIVQLQLHADILFILITLLESLMAKKSMIERELKRQRLVRKYFQRRKELKQQIKVASSFQERISLQRKLQQLPRNSAPVRLHNRCLLTGRPKGYFRDFGLSRHMLREMAHQCLLPGVTKSSW
jgi:small subunit ribosomal protein S14